MAVEPWMLAAALALEACIGYPQALHARIAHPIVHIGRWIDGLERRWNDASRSDAARRGLGVATVIVVAGGAALIGFAVQLAAARIRGGALLIVLTATIGLAQRSLYTHVREVLRPLARGHLAEARSAVAHIVGRDTAALSASGVAAAALESLAESFNDGVVAPAFWFLLGGLPGLFAYKAINTADSLIGHREPRWRAFGWAAARCDDVANLLPARIAGGLLVFAGGGGAHILWRDASKHDSPNAGWPEAAMAGALDVQLGGPATYDGVSQARPTLGVGEAPRAEDLARGLRIYVRASALLWLLAIVIGVLALQREVGVPGP